jgi:hypothetical protein
VTSESNQLEFENLIARDRPVGVSAFRAVNAEPELVEAAEWPARYQERVGLHEVIGRFKP